MVPKKQQERIYFNFKEHLNLLLYPSACCYQSKSHDHGLSQGMEKEILIFGGGKVPNMVMIIAICHSCGL